MSASISIDKSRKVSSRWELWKQDKHLVSLMWMPSNRFEMKVLLGWGERGWEVDRVLMAAWIWWAGVSDGGERGLLCVGATM